MTFNLSDYDRTEQRLLKILFKSGAVKHGDTLESRANTLAKIGKLKGKSGKLTNLYADLLDKHYISFNKSFKAEAELCLQ